MAEPDFMAWLPKKPPCVEGPTLSGSPSLFQLVVDAVQIGESRGIRSPYRFRVTVHSYKVQLILLFKGFLMPSKSQKGRLL